MVAREVSRVQFQGSNVLEATCRWTELDDGPVMSRDALAAGLPPVHHLALGTVEVGDEGGWTVQEKIVGCGEPLVRCEQHMRTGRGRCAVDKTIGCYETLQFVGSHLLRLGYRSSSGCGGRMARLRGEGRS